MHKLIPALLIVIGFVLMAAKIYADGEPGAIPILLMFIGVGWYFITRLRTRSQHNVDRLPK